MDSEGFWVFRCNVCGKVWSAEDEGNIGWAHAHAEKHMSFWSWFTMLWNPEKHVRELDSYIDNLKVKEV